MKPDNLVSHSHQVFTNFMVELTFPKKLGKVVKEPWKLYIDGSSTSTRAGVGVILISPDKQSFTSGIRSNFHATNNEAKYEALINGLQMVVVIGVQHLKIFHDSQLVAYQMSGKYETRGKQMIWYSRSPRVCLKS